MLSNKTKYNMIIIIYLKRGGLMDEVIKLAEKKTKKYLYLALGLILASIILLALALQNQNRDLNPNNLQDFENVDKSLETAKIVIGDTDPIKFATVEGQDQGFYFIINDDNIVSIALISDAQYQEIIKDKKVLIGQSKTITNDIMTSSMNFYNANVNDVLTLENYADYLGNYYLDITVDFNNSTIFYYLLIITGILGILSLLVYFKNRHTTSKTIDNFSNRQASISNNLKKANYYSCCDLIITKEYLFLFKDGLVIVPFDKIIWIYENITKRHILRRKDNMIIYTKDNHSYVIDNLEKLPKSNMGTPLELFKNLKKHCHHLLKEKEFDNIE